MEIIWEMRMIRNRLLRRWMLGWTRGVRCSGWGACAEYWWEEVLRSKLFRVLDSESGLVFVRDTFDEMIAAEEQMLEASFREVQEVSPDSFGGDSGSLSLCYRCFYVVFTLCMCMEISYNTPAGTAKTVSDAVDCQRIAGGGVLANKYEALHRNGSTTRFEGEVLGVIASTPEEGIGSPGHEVLAVEVGTDGRVSIPEKPLLDDSTIPVTMGRGR